MRTTLQTNADNAVPADTDAIALWNPTSVALWSLLLTPAFGAWLTMRNWERLGQPDKARQGRYWFAGMLLAVLAAYCAMPFATAVVAGYRAAAGY